MPTAVALEESEVQAVAERLLGAMATIRRTVRRSGGRPAELSTLTEAQLEIVRLLRRRPGISIAEAAEELKLAPNTVSTLVHQLSDAGVLIRGADQTDRRVARLELSADMGQKVGAWRDRRVVVVGAAIQRLDPSDQAQIRAVLSALDHLALELGARDKQASKVDQR